MCVVLPEWSEHSTVPSHLHCSGMHLVDPETQVNSAGLQVGGRPQVSRSDDSTKPEPSGQEHLPTRALDSRRQRCEHPMSKQGLTSGIKLL